MTGREGGIDGEKREREGGGRGVRETEGRERESQREGVDGEKERVGERRREGRYWNCITHILCTKNKTYNSW